MSNGLFNSDMYFIKLGKGGSPRHNHDKVFEMKPYADTIGALGVSDVIPGSRDKIIDYIYELRDYVRDNSIESSVAERICGKDEPDPRNIFANALGYYLVMRMRLDGLSMEGRPPASASGFVKKPA